MEIRETVKNHKFFADRTIDNWAFMEFLICKEQNALKRMKTMLQEYKNSISSLISKHKKQFDQDLLGYLAELKNKSFTDEELKNMIKELTMGKKENISFVDSTISNSNIIVGSGSGSLNITQTKKDILEKRKQGQNQENDSDIVMVKRKKDSFALLKPITPSISYRFNTPGFEEQMKERVNSIAYIKLDDKDICENEAITNEYASNMNESYSNKYINNYPIAKSFLNDALNQQIEDLLPWMVQHGFGTNSEDTKKAILIIRLILTDFYANCLKPSSTNSLNERTPFVEYVVPIFKYYSAVYNDSTFQWYSSELTVPSIIVVPYPGPFAVIQLQKMTPPPSPCTCEKVLETNKCIVYYNTDDKVKRRLADDIGYFVMDNTESLLFESSGEENDDHTQDVTIKLFECSIRSLKMEMENVQNASFETYKKRKFFTYLYAGDKLTMLSTSVVSREKWGYTLAREAIVPRTWNVRLRWLKVMNLIFYTKAMLEEQREGAAILESEHNGWSEVAQELVPKYVTEVELKGLWI
ncbi:hypothetical protein BDF21DRAFT_489601 [Thamnidium elegans]|nr:hypothetical protein BDF21DRAFT_489601 [Thamnidium elegans]